MAQPKCTKALAKALVEHFSGAPYNESIDTVWHSNGAVRQEAVKRIANPLPTFEGFAVRHGISTRQLSAWEEAYPFFAEACYKARDLQRDFLIQNALMGLYNAAFARVVASSMCGLQDSQRLNIESEARILDDIPAIDDDD